MIFHEAKERSWLICTLAKATVANGCPEAILHISYIRQTLVA